eukprot:CAMPEP_0185823842 /NCGR_PEP_ID=MMETSP1322-20130828/28767_1 /TAXON_ID=265543 /ORGANISM="Minutocellus polymorphus, Strain RCC2270" /LENGTH=80 /DNA_ID=CAMNT_0028521413 /DNA_START=16 /DNA_END=255 /DNA_ORIENTATION=-
MRVQTTRSPSVRSGRVSASVYGAVGVSVYVKWKARLSSSPVPLRLHVRVVISPSTRSAAVSSLAARAAATSPFRLAATSA